MRAVVIGLAAVALFVTACSSSSPEIDPVVQPAVTDLGDRLGVDESAITVVSVEAVTWSNGSLGCPEPGMMYTQALEHGLLIVLEVDATKFEYHSGAGRDPFYCTKSIAPVDAGSSDM